MANNIIMRQITITEEEQALGGDEVFSVDISCPPGNAGPVYFKVGENAESPWLPGEYHYLSRVRLSEITVRGTAGDTVSLVGGTW